MALCESEGIHPAKAVQEFHIINGRPALKADAMLARFQRAGGSVDFTTYTDAKVEATFKHPQGGQLTIDWTMARAKQAGLSTAMWSKYPRQMLRSRVISEGVRAIFPGVLGGLYTEEEVREFGPMKSAAPAVEMPVPTATVMDLERLTEYGLKLTSLLAINQKELERPAAARLCLQILDTWAELTADEQPQVAATLDGKCRAALKKISGLERDMLEREGNTLEMTTEAA
jgi:hypothetical protein